MIQIKTILKNQLIIVELGKLMCIKVLGGSHRRFASVG